MRPARGDHDGLQHTEDGHEQGRDDRDRGRRPGRGEGRRGAAQGRVRRQGAAVRRGGPSALHPSAPVEGVPARRGRARQGLRPSGGVVRRAARRPGAVDDGHGDRAGSNELVLDGGRRVGFDRLVIATGSEPTRLDVPGSDLAGIRYLRTLDDSDGLRDAAGAATQVVVIGSGWIGAEVAASIRQLGREVALVVDTSVPLERVLGTEVGAIFGDVHAHHGVRLVPNQRVVAIHGRDGAVDAVETADGTRIDARPGRRRHRGHAADGARRGRRARGGRRDPGRRAPRVERSRHLRRR